MKIEIILGIIFLFILSFVFLPVKSDIFQRFIYIILMICIIGLGIMIILKNGIGVLSTLFLILLFTSIFGINYYISISSNRKENNKKETNKLFLYLYLAIGLYFFFNQQKKIGTVFINNTLGDCTYHNFSLIIIFFTMVTSIFYTDAPVFILCLIILYYLLT